MWPRLLVSTLLLVICASATAQFGLPGAPSLPAAPRLPEFDGSGPGILRDARPQRLADLRKLRVRELLRTHRERWEADPDGWPMLRGEVGALSPTPTALAAAQTAGFSILSQQVLARLGLTLVVLRAPPGWSTQRALEHLSALDPGGDYDYNHLYLGSGTPVETVDAGAPPSPRLAPARQLASADPVRVGLVDTGVEGTHPAFAGANIRHFGCGGAVIPGAHGTAVASLLVGRTEDFSGVIRGATLYVADVFCGEPGGSMAALAVAFDWLAEQQVAVINISLVGAGSVLLSRVVQAMAARGHLLVAAVGNDGAAAPPLYPAAYPEVVGVTGVDRRRRALPEAGRGPQVAFAAPGAGLRAAQVGGGWNPVRGTSFATPIVAGLLAASLHRPDPVAMHSALAELAATAIDLGCQGVDPVYGRGLVGAWIWLAVDADSGKI